MKEEERIPGSGQSKELLHSTGTQQEIDTELTLVERFETSELSKKSKLPPGSITNPKLKRKCSQQMKLAQSFARAPPPTDANHPILIDDEIMGRSGSPLKDKALGAGVGRKPCKRKSEDSVDDRPILKALKKSEKSRIVRCPVCSKEFTDINNFDLNRHLDGCLGTTQHAC